MIWFHAAFGVFIIGVVLTMAVLIVKDSAATDWKAVLMALLLIGSGLGIGLYMAWPLVALVLDVVRGTETAREIVRAREALLDESDRAEFVSLSSSVGWCAMAMAAAAPFLSWRMRRRDPDSHRPWLVLAISPIAGAVGALHWGALSYFPAASAVPLLPALESTLQHHEVVTVLLLYWMFVWLCVLAASTWTGLTAGPWTMFLSPVPLFPWMVGEFLDFSFWPQTLCWFGSVFLGAVLNEVRTVEQAGELARRAQRAQALNRQLLDAPPGERPAFALYLRRFVSTGTLDTQQVGGDADSLDLETVLSQALRPELQLIGLNRPQAAAIVGADYLFGADADWKATFHRLAAEATLIVLLPPERGSTLSEIAWLKEQDLLSRVIFVMPETVDRDGRYAATTLPGQTLTVREERFVDHAAGWATARAAVLAQTGLDLPVYQPSGALFTIDRTHGVRQLEPLALSGSLFKVAKLRRAVTRLRQAMAPAGRTAVRRAGS